ncbi:MAG: RidA family protein [Flavobacteriales bacterium]|jgi:2-iminobutanoate/2-iminopropanoate deaminase|nr:RidA family protein [Bacteroidota bacterium]MDP4588829.1 RidA family protein [Flavobacteriales bacterium]MDP4952898.1 RidA family protein [Flavobacteriales bacterium]
MKKIIRTDNAPAPIGPYNQAVAFNGMVYASGQIAINPKTGELEIDDLAHETHLVMKNLQAVLEAAGSDLSMIIKTSIFLSDMSLFQAVNEIYGSYFESDFPARETVAVKGLPKGVNVEISAVAAVK